jgi:bifunctional non-homologous end joining protein LigD
MSATETPSDPLPSARLFYREAGSDKEYHAAVLQRADGYVVEFAFGRRGSTLRPGTKTQAPVSRERALAIYTSLIDSKTREGYTPDGTGTLFVGTPLDERRSGLLPQLLNAIDAAEMDAYLCNDAWMVQEKIDGERRLCRCTEKDVEGVNRKGLLVPLPADLHKDLLQLTETAGAGTVLDGEVVGDLFHIFDLLAHGSEDLRSTPAGARLDRLGSLWDEADARCSAPLDHIRLVQTGRGIAAKTALLHAVRGRGGEGIVLKREDAPYTAGRPASRGSQLKFKLWESATCLVHAVNAQRSVAVALLDGDAVVPVGNVTIPANRVPPATGAIVEVRYLYAYPGGALYQPQYQGERPDMDRGDCVLSQVKYRV